MADFNGVISKSAVQQGAAATQGMELFTLQNTDKVSVDINVSKYDYDKVKEGRMRTLPSVTGNIPAR